MLNTTTQNYNPDNICESENIKFYISKHNIFVLKVSRTDTGKTNKK